MNMSTEQMKMKRYRWTTDEDDNINNWTDEYEVAQMNGENTKWKQTEDDEQMKMSRYEWTD